MRLIPFVSTDKFRKASEQHLPEDERRQAIAFVEEKLGRELTATERTRFVQVAGIAPQMVPGDDPVELRPVRRMTFSQKPSMPGIKGGQDRSGAEIEQDARELMVVLALVAAVLLGFAGAELIAQAADSFGAAYLAN